MPSRKPVISIESAPVRRSMQDHDPEPPTPKANSVRRSPVLQVHRGTILRAALRGRPQKSIAREFDVSVRDIWQVAVEELRTRKAAA